MVSIGVNDKQIIVIGKNEDVVLKEKLNTAIVPFDRIVEVTKLDIESLVYYFLQENKDYRIKLSKKALYPFEFVEKV